jgi:hypothetical protein
MLIPLIITGLVVGSMVKGHKVSKKKLAGAAVLSGVLNGAQAYLIYLLTPQPTFISAGGASAAASTFFQSTAVVALRGASEVDFAISSILAGILIVLVIVGIAKLYAGSRGGTEEEAGESAELANEK